MYVQKDDMLEAKKLMTRALELATSVLGKKHHFVADIYTKVRMGMLFYSLLHLRLERKNVRSNR